MLTVDFSGVMTDNFKETQVISSSIHVLIFIYCSVCYPPHQKKVKNWFLKLL